MKKFFDPQDLVGKRVNNLLVVEYCGYEHEKATVHGKPVRQKKHYYLVQCDCGKRKIVRRGHLTSGNKTLSCGCSRFKLNNPVVHELAKSLMMNNIKEETNA